MMLYYSITRRRPMLEVMPHTPLRHLLDRFGATGSLLCAAHCAVIPLLLALAPSLGFALWLGESTERALVLFVTLLGLTSLVWGYRRHRVIRALAVLVPGLIASPVSRWAAFSPPSSVARSIVTTTTGSQPPVRGSCPWGSGRSGRTVRVRAAPRH